MLTIPRQQPVHTDIDLFRTDVVTYERILRSGLLGDSPNEELLHIHMRIFFTYPTHHLDLL